MAKFPRWLQPHHKVYLLGHLLLIAIGVAVFARGGGIAVGIGTSLFAAGTAGIVVFCYVHMTSVIADRLAVLTEFGFVNTFAVRGIRINDEYENRVSKARHHIDIMGFGLQSLLKDHGAKFAQWQAQADVRILLLDPDAPDGAASYADQRDREEGNSLGTIGQAVREFVSSTKGLRGGGPGQSFNVRLYKCLPSMNVFRIDDELFWGPYLVGQQSRNTPTFLVRRGIMFDRVMAHFEQIWRSEDLSKSVPAEWLGG